MTFNEAVLRVGARLNKNPSGDATVASRIKNHINDACQAQWDSNDWSFKSRESSFVLTADITNTGSMTATNGSRTVTASTAVFDSTAHVEAWIRFSADTYVNWYKILSVNSTTQVTLEIPYQGTTGSGKTYELKRTDYTLPTEVWDIDSAIVTHRQVRSPLAISEDLRFDIPLVNATGTTPNMFCIRGSDFKGGTYTTGTVSISINTKTLTGSNTAWLGNVYAGDSITIGTDTNTYMVYSVDSDTQITLYNNVTMAAAGATYTISRQFQRVIRIFPTPNQPYVCIVNGLRKYAPLVGNNDTNEFLLRYSYAVIESAVWRELGSSPDPREDSNYQKAAAMWDSARADDKASSRRANFRPIFNHRVM